MYGYCGKVLRVNLTKGTLSDEPLNEEWARRFIGGRGLALRYLWDTVGPQTDPLGPENVLIVAPGPFGGTGAPMGSRFVVSAKSPLSGLLGDTEAGGFFGHELKTAGYDLVIFEGRAPKPVYLAIDEGGARLVDASDLWGRSTFEVHRLLTARHPGGRTLLIGQAGENKVRYANVIHDMRYAAGRAGLGAVMGSKNVKGIVVKGHGEMVPVADRAALKAETGALTKDILDNTSCQILGRYGTWNGLAGLIANGILPTKNFQTGVLDGAERINGDAFLTTVYRDRRTCYACPIRCRRVVEATGEWTADREYAGPQYETVAALGSLLLNTDPAAICHANQLCDAYGVDTISIGICIAYTMESFERGVLSAKEIGLEPRWGDAHAIMRMIDMIVHREGFGNVLAEGVKRAAQQVGRGSEAWALEVKGQELPMHDPRGKKGVGLSYATHYRGADHMESMHDEGFARDDALPDLGFTKAMARTDLAGKPLLVKRTQDYWGSLADSLVICKLPLTPGRPLTAPRLLRIINAVTGWDWTLDDMLLAGERITNLARLFAVREGVSRKDDRLPDRLGEPLPEGATAGESLPNTVLNALLDEYYALRGWDAHGIPTVAKLESLGLGELAYVVQEAERGAV